MTIESESDFMYDYNFMCEFNIFCNYGIERCNFFEFELEHSKEIGYASYDGKKFIVHTSKTGKQIIDEIINAGGGFSHGGMFDNRGYFILSEVSIVKYPRFKTEDFKWLMTGKEK